MVALQKYTIRNMDTGEVYVLDGDDPPRTEGLARSSAGSQGVTDVMSGNKMTFEELDRALGLQKTIAVRLDAPWLSDMAVGCMCG